MPSSDQPRATPVDYIAQALAPALIMALIGSLVFFLAEVLYQGKYPDRLRWTLFFFIIGAVLVVRISLTGGIANRALFYGLALGVPTWFALQMFIDYPEGSPVAPARAVINLGLIVVVWWCAYQLTRDCTNLDERTEVTGQGVLQAAGLDADVRAAGDEEEQDDEDAAADAKPKEENESGGFWARYRQAAEKRRKRTLGVCVVYFSLAALPLFGLGQALIPADAGERRHYAFWLMTVYVGSALGLLLTTCFLGLRRYLRQRKLQMPAAMTGVWLAVGGAMIALLLAVGAVLPRPWSENPWLGAPAVESPENKASRYAVKGDSSVKDDGAGGKNRKGEQPGDKAKGGATKDKASGEKDKDRAGKGDKDGKDAGAKKDAKDGQGGERDKGEKDSKDDQRKGDAAKKDQSKRDGEKGDRQDESGSQQPPPSDWLASLEWLKPILKWLVFLVLAVVVLLALLRSGLGWLAGVSDWAKKLLEAWNNFWAKLFGGWGKNGDEEAMSEREEPRAPPQPFAAFADPFESGAAGRWSARELVRYTFAALEAWANERDLGRQDDETALEFSERLAEALPNMAADVRRLAALFSRAAYAPGGMPSNTADVVRAFWQRLATADRQAATV